MPSAPLTLAPASSDTIDHQPSGLAATAAYLGLEPDELVAWLDHGGTVPVLARAFGRSAEDAVAIVLAHAPDDDSIELRLRLVTGTWHPQPATPSGRLAA
jgi:hypothetical protein